MRTAATGRPPLRAAAAAALIAVLFLARGLSAQSSQPIQRDSVALEAATRAVASQLRCVVCQGLSIEDSPSELAQSMRAVVRDQLAQGRTADEVKDYFVARYGEWVLLEPRATGFNLAVYILPVILLLAGLGVVVVLAKKWSASGRTGDTIPIEDPDLAAWDELVRRD